MSQTPVVEEQQQQEQQDDYNQNEPHYYQSNGDNEAAGYGDSEVQEEEDDELEDEDEGCMHPMHMAVLFFSILSLAFCIVALATPNSYVISADTNRFFGIFNMKNGTDAKLSAIKYDNIYLSGCEVRTAAQWKSRQQMSQAAIILGALFCLAAIVMAFLGKKIPPIKFAMIGVTFMAFLCIFLGVLRLVYTYEKWMFCNKNFCDYVKNNPAMQLPGCSASFGYSFALLTIAVAGMIFSVIFSVMRVVFADWYLRKESDEDRPAGELRPRRHVEDGGDVPEARDQQTNGGATGAATTNDRTPRSRSPSKYGDQEAPRQGPGHSPQTNSGGSAQAQPQQQQQQQEEQAAAGEGPASMDDLPPGEWVWDEECGLYWSEEDFLYLDPETKHYYDPKSDKWYNPDTDEWYDGEE